jgi:hypothetical protein
MVATSPFASDYLKEVIVGSFIMKVIETVNKFLSGLKSL